MIPLLKRVNDGWAEQPAAAPRIRSLLPGVPWLLASAFYVGLTIAVTWPLAINLPVVLPHDLGDPGLNAWIIWWNAHVMPLTERWWDAPAFWPSHGALAFSETLLGLSPITGPIQWLGGGPIAAYNVAFLLTFPLSALAAHALVPQGPSGRHDAAVIAGLVYGFNPFRVAHFPQIQVMTSYWMPLALLGLHEYMTARKARWLAIFAGAWLMQALSNGYYLLFFPVLLGLWIGWFAWSRATVRPLAAIIAAWVVGSLPLIPMLWTYRRIHAAFGFQRYVGEINVFGADLTSFLDASPLLRFWHLQRFHRPEGELFPGFTAAALLLLLMIHWLWTSKPAGRLPRACLVLLLGAVTFIGIAGEHALTSSVPWSIRHRWKHILLSVHFVSKPLLVGVLLFGLNTACPWSSRVARRVAAAIAKLMFYLLATAYA